MADGQRHHLGISQHERRRLARVPEVPGAAAEGPKLRSGRARIAGTLQPGLGGKAAADELKPEEFADLAKSAVPPVAGAGRRRATAAATQAKARWPLTVLDVALPTFVACATADPLGLSFWRAAQLWQSHRRRSTEVSA